MVIGKLEWSSIVVVVVVSLSVYYKVLSAELRFVGRNAMSWGCNFEVRQAHLGACHHSDILNEYY